MMFTFLKTKDLASAATYAVVASLTILGLLFISFFMAEPSVTSGQTNRSFTITTEILGEASFEVPPSNVDLGSLSGLTGGTATGSTDFVVTSNSGAGYTVTIQFADADADGAAMKAHSVFPADDIKNYLNIGAAGPVYDFATSSTDAQFAFTVYSDAASDTDPQFTHNGTTCENTGSQSDGTLANSCWMEPTTTAAYQIVNRTSAAPTGATSTIMFLVDIQSGVTVDADFYTATATLTLTSS